VDPDPESEIFLTLDLGSGMEIIGSEIRVKHPGSATLLNRIENIYLVKRILLFLREQQNLLAFASNERLPRTLDSKAKRNSDAAAKATRLA